MSFVVAYALAGAGTLLVVLWVMLYLRYSSQYDIMIAAIDKKQFSSRRSSSSASGSWICSR